MRVELVWATPGGDDLIAKMARVSNPANQDNKATAPSLIKYLIRKFHWSPFEMVNACVEIHATRDIIRQILRHKSMFFQEFSGRYAEYDDEPEFSEVRLQDKKNRQNSIESDDKDLNSWWYGVQLHVWDVCYFFYQLALKRGIAKELARKLLPEGIVPSVLYVNATMRSWIHYWSVRCTQETQKEHRLVAEATREVILPLFPSVQAAL